VYTEAVSGVSAVSGVQHRTASSYFLLKKIFTETFIKRFQVITEESRVKTSKRKVKL
jgi:hypothetical protein